MKKLLLLLLCVPLMFSCGSNENNNPNAITKLLPYAIGKKKTIEDTEDSEPINILININGQEI